MIKFTIKFTYCYTHFLHEQEDVNQPVSKLPVMKLVLSVSGIMIFLGIVVYWYYGALATAETLTYRGMYIHVTKVTM